MHTLTRELPEYDPFPNDSGRNSRQEKLELPALVRALRLPTGGRVLEVGCGRGVALPGLAKLCQPDSLVGLDLDGELLDEARRHVEAAQVECQLVHGDVREMPFDDTSFDLIVDFGTLYHIARPEQALNEIARVLRPGGVLVEETKLSQSLSHPARSRGRRVPWAAEPRLRSRCAAALWTSRIRAL